MLTLAGCATAPPVAPVAATSAPEQWRVDARIGVNDDGQAWQASAIWEQQPDRYDIALIGPLGQGRVDVRSGADGVTLRTDSDTYRATNADELIYSALGLRLPVTGLRYWLRGLADPASTAEIVRDADGRTLMLRQDGWRIDYPNWLSVDGYRLPQRIRARRDALGVTVVIKQWTLPPAG